MLDLLWFIYISIIYLSIFKVFWNIIYLRSNPPFKYIIQSFLAY